MARLRQRGPTRWEIVIELGTDQSGKRKQKSISHTGDRTSAELALARAQIKHAEGYFTTEGLTTIDVCEARISHAAHTWSPITRKNYDQHMRSIRTASWAHEPVETLNPLVVKSWYASGRSPQMLQTHRFLRSCFNHALRTEAILRSPFSLVSPPSVNKRRISPPTREEVQQLLLASKKNPIVYTIVALAVSTGCRRGTLIAHQNADYQRRGKVKELHVKRRSIQSPGGTTILEGTKTGPGYVIPLAESTASVLEAWIETLHQQALEASGTPLRPDCFLFSLNLGRRPASLGYLAQNFDRIRKTLDGPPIRFHDLRHFAATEMIAAGIPIATVAERLNHANPDITMKVYAHSTTELNQQAADVCGSILDSVA